MGLVTDKDLEDLRAPDDLPEDVPLSVRSKLVSYARKIRDGPLHSRRSQCRGSPIMMGKTDNHASNDGQKQGGENLPSQQPSGREVTAVLSRLPFEMWIPGAGLQNHLTHICLVHVMPI